MDVPNSYWCDIKKTEKNGDRKKWRQKIFILSPHERDIRKEQESCLWDLVTEETIIRGGAALGLG